MASDEIVCQLRGVAFAIARLRRAIEPPEAAWDSTGYWLTDADTNDFCGEGSGCELIEREVQGRSPSSVVEHISGPGCISRNGYSGQRISLEEMKGCRAIQCLVHKDADWEPEPNDQDFELESDYFLTGVGYSPPELGLLNIPKTARHGADRLWFFNLIDLSFFVGTANPNTVALPFHPTCFEIFKKVSQLRLGSINVEGLWCWRAFPRDHAVKTGYDRFWRHEPGSEDLAANPIEIPGFAAMFSGAIGFIGYTGRSKVVFDWESKEPNDPSATNYRVSLPPKSLDSADPFTKLSAELSDMVLACLSSKDIANLRLASSVFQQLPTILFPRLLLEDMPWFWEARGMHVGDTIWYNV
ncbi:hypothetical protein MMC17_000301 [Xylographa soralifera]|nr:hypothetical protein [Xylographa soralifera]